MVVWAMLGMWAGLFALPGESRMLWAGAGLVLVAIAALASAGSLRLRILFWADFAWLRGFGLMLLVASIRTVPDMPQLDVPRRCDGWYWTQGSGIIEDSSGLKLRCYDTLQEGFAYHLRLDLIPLDSAQVPWAFDAAKAAAPRGIVARAKIRARLTRVPMAGAWWRRSAIWGRNQIQKLPWGPASRGLTQALWIGDMDDLPESSMQAFQALGIIHVLSVSGFHLGLIWVGMLGLLPLVPRAARGLVTLIALAVVWAFVAVVGFAPSAIRSAAMITVVGIIGLSGNRLRGIDAFALAQVGLLALFPKMAYQLGFQLSSAAVLGLIMASPPATTGLKSSKLIAGLRTSLAAQWATTPLALPIFHTMPLTFLLSNFLLVPPLLMVYPYSILAFCGLPMPDPEPLLEGLARIASDPRLVWTDRFPSPTQTALLAFYALAGLMALRRRRPWIVAAALAFTVLVMAQSAPRLHHEQRWIAKGRGIACIQVRGDSVRVYGTKYLLANDFLWTRSMQPYFKSRGVKYLEKHPRSYEVMEQGLRAHQIGLGHELPKRYDLTGLARVVNPQNLGSAL